MDALVVEKARSDRARIERIVSLESAGIRRAFREFFDTVTSDQARREVRELVERGRITTALGVLDRYTVPLGDAVDQVFEAGGRAEVAAVRAAVGARVSVGFDATLPRAAEIMRRNRLEFVSGFTRTQREATRAALEDALRAGTGPRAAARAFRDSIGLTRTQQAAVDTYRRLLESADRAALGRDLRDRRSDRAVARAAAEGEPLGAERVARMVERYRARYITLRAETIARTETIRALSPARHEAVEQMIGRGLVRRRDVVRTWYTNIDGRERDTHYDMDEQERGMDEPFESPSGELLMYPGDPSASAGEVINCRCAVLYEFRRGRR